MDSKNTEVSYENSKKNHLKYKEELEYEEGNLSQDGDL